jgi:hypothetical protein
MARLQTILILTSLVSASWASPIEETIGSLKDLEKIGAKVTVFPLDKGDKATSYTFTIRWKSKVSDDPIGSRLDLLVGDDGRGAEPRLQVRYSRNAEGVFEADFTIARAELTAARLAFRESQQTHYFLNLKCLVDEFPNRDLGDPFKDNQDADQAVAPNRSLPPSQKSMSPVRGSDD